MPIRPPPPNPAGLKRRQCLVAGVASCAIGMVRATESPPVLRFGLTPVFLDDRVSLLRQWGEHLERVLGMTVQFVQFSSYSQMVDAVRASQVHFAWICGYPYVRHRHDMHLVTVPVWRGRPLYQSYLIADEASSVRTVDDLQGRTFAYSDPLSNSGFLYPQHLLRSRGHDPARHFRKGFFTYSHRHVVDAVSQGLAEAGAVDGYVWETLAELSPAVTSRTRVMLRSPDFGFPPIVAPLSTPAPLVRHFSATLHGMAGSEQGRKVLSGLRLDGFTDTPAALFDSIADMTRSLQF